MRKIILLLFIFSACTSTSKIGGDCAKFKEDVIKNWKYSEEEKYYKTNFEFIKRLDSTYKNCLKGMTKQEIEKVFGKVYTTESNPKKKILILNYFTSPCNPRAYIDYWCNYYSIFLDSTSKVIDAFETGEGTSNHQ